MKNDSLSFNLDQKGFRQGVLADGDHQAPDRDQEPGTSAQLVQPPRSRTGSQRVGHLQVGIELRQLHPPLLHHRDRDRSFSRPGKHEQTQTRKKK